MLDAFGIVGGPEEVAGRILARYGDVVDRTSAAYANLPKDAMAKIIAELTAALGNCARSAACTRTNPQEMAASD